jgi:transglutaminase-like putative cysteine protease
MKPYLAASDIIDWKHPAVREVAAHLAKGCSDDIEIAKNCFERVRDDVRHSHDFQLNPVTSKASDVLHHKTGYCYAKSHLLAALLRANHIPAGFCYQRLSRGQTGAPYCLHGLNAVYLENFGWYRVDARGNKEGVDARFAPPVERLAFSAGGKREGDFPEIWPSPLPLVISVLEKYESYEAVYENLPDIEIIAST